MHSRFQNNSRGEGILQLLYFMHFGQNCILPIFHIPMYVCVVRQQEKGLQKQVRETKKSLADFFAQFHAIFRC